MGLNAPLTTWFYESHCFLKGLWFSGGWGFCIWGDFYILDSVQDNLLTSNWWVVLWAKRVGVYYHVYLCNVRRGNQCNTRPVLCCRKGWLNIFRLKESSR